MLRSIVNTAQDDLESYQEGHINSTSMFICIMSRFVRFWYDLDSKHFWLSLTIIYMWAISLVHNDAFASYEVGIDV